MQTNACCGEKQRRRWLGRGWEGDIGDGAVDRNREAAQLGSPLTWGMGTPTFCSLQVQPEVSAQWLSTTGEFSAKPVVLAGWQVRPGTHPTARVTTSGP